MDGYWIIRRTRQKSGSGRRPADVDVDIYVHDVDVDVVVDIIVFFVTGIFKKTKWKSLMEFSMMGDVALHSINVFLGRLEISCPEV